MDDCSLAFSVDTTRFRQLASRFEELRAERDLYWFANDLRSGTHKFLRAPPPDGLRTEPARKSRVPHHVERGTADEAAAILGLPTRTVQKLAARGELPGAAKFGRRWTFDLRTLRRHVISKERQAWQDGNRKLHPDATGGGIPFGAALRFAAGSSAGRLTQMIQASQKRVAKRAR